MLNAKILDDIGNKINQLIADSPATDMDKNLRGLLQNVFAKLDLVTREEFDVQSQVLLRTREQLQQLEQTLAELEARMSDTKR
jgi:hypothetical protein